MKPQDWSFFFLIELAEHTGGGISIISSPLALLGTKKTRKLSPAWRTCPEEGGSPP